MRLTTQITPNNCDKKYLRILEINNLKIVNLTITGESLPKKMSFIVRLETRKSSMFLTSEGRLYHNTGEAVWNDLSPRDFLVFPMGNCNSSSSEERSWYLHFSFKRTRLKV